MESVSQAETTLVAELREPVDLRGRLAQHLGTIRRVGFSCESRRIVLVELETDWQTLQLNVDLLEFDRDAGCWYLKRSPDLMHRPDADDRG